MPFSIQRTSCSIGAVVTGLDLRHPIADGDMEALKDAFWRYSVLIFPEQDLAEATLVAFSSRWGELEKHVLDQWLLNEWPQVYILGNVPRQEGKPVGGDKVARVWHTDLSFTSKPAMATLLYAVEVPERDGNTEFADMHAAYEALPSALKEPLDGRMAVHDLRRTHSLTEEQDRAAPAVEHPVFRTHPVTGKKAIYLGAHVTHIAGRNDEGRRLVDEVSDFATQPQFVYSHRWRPGDLVIWDNAAVMHRGTAYDERERRLMLRTTVKGGPTQ